MRDNRIRFKITAEKFKMRDKKVRALVFIFSNNQSKKNKMSQQFVQASGINLHHRTIMQIYKAKTRLSEEFECILCLYKEKNNNIRKMQTNS